MFCKYCGNELADNAVVCTKCGCLAVNLPVEEIPQTQPIQQAQPIPQTPQQKQNGGLKKKIPAIILSALTLELCITMFAFIVLTFWTFLMAVIGTDVTQEDWSGLGWMGVVFFVYMMYALIGVAPIALATGITGFCFGKQTDSSVVRKLSVAGLVVSIVLAATTAFLWTMVFFNNM